MDILKNKSIILFDGVCNLCNSSVNFILKHDKKKRYTFASLQSDAAKEILLQFHIKKINLETVILIENGEFYNKSSAVLLILKRLSCFCKVFYSCIIFPKFFRDFIYDIIAKNRYQWFGFKNQCMIPSKEVLDRFL